MEKGTRKDIRITIPPGSPLLQQIEKWAEAESRTMAGMVRTLLLEASRARLSTEVARLKGGGK